jgi:hypothetical protein
MGRSIKPGARSLGIAGTIFLAVAGVTQLLQGPAPASNAATVSDRIESQAAQGVDARAETGLARSQVSAAGAADLKADAVAEAQQAAAEVQRSREVALAETRVTAPAAVVLTASAASANTPAGAKAYAQRLLDSIGQGGQMGCLTALWNRESGWRWNAENPFSGAYGIAQALPAGKMRVAGANWAASGVTQVRWGVLFYIRPVYGSPCGAWGHEERQGWY